MTLKRKALTLCTVLVFSVTALTGCSSKNSDKNTTSKLKDGTYTKTADVAVKGYKNTMTMTVSDGKITVLNWDCLDESGAKKSELSVSGKYVMTPNGPTWAAQSEELSKYVIKNQSVDGIKLNDEGKTDVVAGVSIAVKDFVDYATALMQEASK